MKVLALSFSLVSLALAASRKTAPKGALVVQKPTTISADVNVVLGREQKFTTISAAVAALSNTTTSEQFIFINPGTYAEQVYVPKLSGPLTIQGYTTDDSRYAKNQVTIVASESQKTKPNNDLTGTLRVWTSDFKLYNVNVRNAFGEGSQAIAVSAQAGRQGYYAVALYGYQDTLLSNIGTQLYAKSYIEGATDFIFGQRAQAWFENCDFGVVKAATGWITASGRSSDDAGWYVINRSRVAAAPGNIVADGAYYLGRPWRNFARVVFQNTELSRVINQAGWAIWNVGDDRTNQTYFGEFGNKGAGAQGKRADFAKQIQSPVAIETVLGANYASEKYVDRQYLK